MSLMLRGAQLGLLDRATVPHHPDWSCGGLHCMIHNVDERIKGRFYRACLECGHLYARPRHLRRQYHRATWRRVTWHWTSRARTQALGETVLRALRHDLRWLVSSWTTLANQIHACPYCDHDF